MNLSICNFINWSGKACDSMHSRGAHTVQMGGHTCIIEEHICPGEGHNALSRNISREEEGMKTTMEHTYFWWAPGGIFANNGLARAHSHAHAYYPSFSVRVDKAMRTENLRMVTAMRTTIALIFCVHDLSHTHTENLRLE